VVRSFTGYCHTVVLRAYPFGGILGRTNPLDRRKKNNWSMTNHRAES
jgi:hypothetical protein